MNLKWKKTNLLKINKEKTDTIIKFLCSESGSHDYSIRRDEAINNLGINVEKPTMELYSIIKQIHDDISEELELENPFEPMIMLNNTDQPNHPYSFRRGLIETMSDTDVFVSEGVLAKLQDPRTGQILTSDNRMFEGWRHENN